MIADLFAVRVRLAQFIVVLRNLLDLKDFPSPVSILLHFYVFKAFQCENIGITVPLPSPFLLRFAKG